MDDLAAFIEARLADDEAIARDALHGPEDQPWRAKGYDQVVQRGFKNATEMNDKLIADCAPMGATRVRHIARHGPARVLREVTAKRAILERHRDPGHMCPEPPDDEWTYWEAGEQVRAVYPCGDLRSLAAVWSDHPDYRAEWAPAATGNVDDSSIFSQDG